MFSPLKSRSNSCMGIGPLLPIITSDGVNVIMDSSFQTMDRLKRALDNNGIKYSEKRFETEKGIESLGENPFVCCVLIKDLQYSACKKDTS